MPLLAIDNWLMVTCLLAQTFDPPDQLLGKTNISLVEECLSMILVAVPTTLVLSGSISATSSAVYLLTWMASSKMSSVVLAVMEAVLKSFPLVAVSSATMSKKVLSASWVCNLMPSAEYATKWFQKKPPPFFGPRLLQ